MPDKKPFTFTKLTSQDYKNTRWKNGGGSTFELYREPKESTLNDFNWRISIASICESGEFSIFPGYNRSILKLQGGNVSLHDVDSKKDTELDESVPFYFSGNQKIYATLNGETVQDFNVFTKTDSLNQNIEVYNFENFGKKYVSIGHWAFMYCPKGRVKISNALELAAGESIVIRALDVTNLCLNQSV